MSSAATSIDRPGRILVVRNNAANGIRIQALDNTLTQTHASGNGAATGGNPAMAYDLPDTNPACDANAWHGNTPP